MIQLNVETVSGEDFSVTIDRDITIGRSKSCDVRIPLDTFSGHHLSVIQTAAGFAVFDAGSTNGTTYDGKPLVPGERVHISSSLVLEVLDVRLTFTPVLQHAAQFTLEDSAALARDLLAAALSDQGSEELPYLEVDGVQHEFSDDAFFDQQLMPLDHAVGAAFVISRSGDGFVVTPTKPVQLNDSVIDDVTVLPSGSRLSIESRSGVFIDPLEAVFAELDSSPQPGTVQTHPVAEPSPPLKEADSKPAQKKGGWSAAEWGLFVFAIALILVGIAGIGWVLTL